MISIIVPTLMEEKYIGKLLESIKKQNYSDYEIIVVDAFSKDRTKDICMDYGVDFQEMFGRNTSKQRNIGASRASGDILLFMDADVVLRNSRVLGIVSGYFNSHPEYVGGVCNVYPIPEEASWYDNLMHFFLNKFIRVCLFLGIGAGMGAFQVVRAKKFVGYDEKKYVAEDIDIIQRLKKKGKIKFFKFKVYVSLRRFKREGYFKVMKNWIFKSRIQKVVR